MTRFLSREDVVRIHDTLSDAPILHPDRLDAAVGQPSLERAGGYAYDSLFLQAAVLLHRIATGHGFVDGNKRTSWLACVTFLELNDVRIRDDVQQSEVVDFVVAVVASHLSQEDITRWLEDAAASR